MNEKEKDDFLHDLYYNKKFMTGRDSMFNHIRNTLKNTDISRRYIAAFLAKQETHQLNTQRKKSTNIRPINSGRPGALRFMGLGASVVNPMSKKYFADSKLAKNIASEYDALKKNLELFKSLELRDLEMDKAIARIKKFQDSNIDINSRAPNLFDRKSYLKAKEGVAQGEATYTLK